MKNEKELEQECEKRITRYLEEHERYVELLRQFLSPSWVGLDNRIKSRNRVLTDSARKEIKKARDKVNKAHKEMNEACNLFDEP